MNFLKRDIWRIHRARLPRGQAFGLHLLRVVLLAAQRFVENRCQLRASALTFYSLISIVPVAAMAFGVAKGFGFEKMLETQLREKLAGHEEVFDYVIQFSTSLLENTKGGLLAGAGLIVLFWAVVKVLGQIEDSLNDIWSVRKRRTLGRKFSDYLSLMLVCPVLVILSSSVTIFVTTSVTLILKKISILGVFSPLVLLLLKLLPFALLWGLFTFIYLFMPNTKVRFSSGLFAGILAGTLFQAVQWIYITFQVGAAKYNAIYGSFAAFPLFLVWLEMSWLIVLFGAELSHAYQNADRFEFDPRTHRLSRRLTTLLSLQVAHYLTKAFAAGDPAPDASRISKDLGIPLRLVDDIAADLVQAGILARTETDDNGGRGFQPARDIGDLTVRDVVDALDRLGLDTLTFPSASSWTAMEQATDTFALALDAHPANRPLKEL